MRSGVYPADSSTTLSSEESERSADSSSEVSDLIATSDAAGSTDGEEEYSPSDGSDAPAGQAEGSETGSEETGAEGTDVDAEEVEKAGEAEAGEAEEAEEAGAGAPDPDLDGPYWRRAGGKRRRTGTRTFVEEFDIAAEFTRLQEAAGVRRRKPANPAVEAMKASMLAVLFGDASDSGSGSDEPLMLGLDL